ncbi:hypothetical protein V6N13_102102 [Hibiscus sabdariffa]
MALRNLAPNSTQWYTGEVCLKLPPKIVSPGLPVLFLDKRRKSDFMDYSAPRLQLQTIIFYVLTQATHILLKNLGLPLFVSQILAGIILRLPNFGDYHYFFNHSDDSILVLGAMGGFGFLFFLFLSGVKMDVSLTFKSGKKAVYIGFLTVLMPLLACLITNKDSLALAFVMISKGIVEIRYYNNMSDSMVISKPHYAFLIYMSTLIAIIVPILVKWLYDPSRKQSSLALDVLHLVKLSGRATPLFIGHQKQDLTTSDNSYSENVVIAFKQFERHNAEVVSLNVFTAVSPPILMYEDICNLAIEHSKCFILLPFHRRWYIDGSIESEDQTIRSLNCNILEMAPCSVGILVEGRRKVSFSAF